MNDNYLWAAQLIAAVVFGVAGLVKVVLPRERLAERMHWASTWPRWRIKALGLLEIAGALGLVLPGLLGLPEVLMPLAAIGLGLLMIGAVFTHRSLDESVAPPLVALALCLFIVAGRLP